MWSLRCIPYEKEGVQAKASGSVLELRRLRCIKIICWLFCIYEVCIALLLNCTVASFTIFKIVALPRVILLLQFLHYILLVSKVILILLIFRQVIFLLLHCMRRISWLVLLLLFTHHMMHLAIYFFWCFYISAIFKPMKSWFFDIHIAWSTVLAESSFCSFIAYGLHFMKF